MPNGSAKTIERLYGHLVSQDKKAALKAREAFAKTDENWNFEDGSPLDEIARLFTKFVAWELDPRGASIQKVILDSTEGGWTWYNRARKNSRLLLFDLCYQVVCNPMFKEPERTLELARSRAKIVADPKNIVIDDKCAEYVATMLASGKKGPAINLLDDCYNASRRDSALPRSVDLQTIVIAGRWVDPGLPLWMMTNPVLLNVLQQSLTEHGAWTKDVLRKQFSKLCAASVERFPRQPISDVTFGGPGYRGINTMTLAAKVAIATKHDLGFELEVQASRRRNK